MHKLTTNCIIYYMEDGLFKISKVLKYICVCICKNRENKIKAPFYDINIKKSLQDSKIEHYMTIGQHNKNSV